MMWPFFPAKFSPPLTSPSSCQVWAFVHESSSTKLGLVPRRSRSEDAGPRSRRVSFLEQREKKGEYGDVENWKCRNGRNYREREREREARRKREAGEWNFRVGAHFGEIWQRTVVRLRVPRTTPDSARRTVFPLFGAKWKFTPLPSLLEREKPADKKAPSNEY